MGLHTSDVIVGNIGAPGRINYTIVGDAVNTAGRIEQLGKEIGATARAAGNTVNAVFAGNSRIRGRQEKIDVYRL